MYEYPQARLPDWVQFSEEDEDQQPNVSPFVDALKKRMSAGAVAGSSKAGISMGAEGKGAGMGAGSDGGGMKSL